MDKKDKQKRYHFTILALTALTSSVTFLQYRDSFADNSIAQIDQQSSATSDETQQKIDELQKRADIYRQIIDIKKQQSNSLNDQLSLTASNIQQVQAQIDASKQQIDDYNSQIIRLGAQIKAKEETISFQKKLLSNLMQAYYEVTQKNPLSAYLSDGNFASFLVTKDQLSQTGDKIKSLAETVADLKSSLEVQSADLDTKKTAIVTASQKLQDQNNNLQNVKDQRQSL